MADKKPKESAADGGDDAPVEGKKKLSGKTLILFIVLPLLLVLGGGGAAVYFFVLKKPDKTAEAHGDAHGGEHGAPKGGAGHGGDGHAIDPAQLLFHPMPEILVNLNSGGRGNVYLKLNVELELRAGADIVALEAVMPRIIDKFQLYLRELRVEDLSGSAGMYRVKEELLRRVNIAAKPVVVNDVLFKELIIQ